MTAALIAAAVVVWVAVVVLLCVFNRAGHVDEEGRDQ